MSKLGEMIIEGLKDAIEHKESGSAGGRRVHQVKTTTKEVNAMWKFPDHSKPIFVFSDKDMPEPKPRIKVFAIANTEPTVYKALVERSGIGISILPMYAEGTSRKEAVESLLDKLQRMTSELSDVRGLVSMACQFEMEPGGDG